MTDALAQQKTGKEAVALGVELDVVETKKILWVQGVPHAEVVMGDTGRLATHGPPAYVKTLRKSILILSRTPTDQVLPLFFFADANSMTIGTNETTMTTNTTQ